MGRLQNNFSEYRELVAMGYRSFFCLFENFLVTRDKFLNYLVHHCKGKTFRFSRNTQAGLRGKEVDGSWTVSILLDETAVVLGAGSRMDGGPAMLTVVAKTVDVATEVGGIASIAVHPLTLIAHLIIQNIRLHLNLQDRGYT